MPFHFEFNTCILSLFALHEMCTFTWNSGQLLIAIAGVTTEKKNQLLPYKFRTQSQLQCMKHTQKSMAFHEHYQARYPALAFSVVSVLEHNMLFCNSSSMLSFPPVQSI